MHLHQVHLPMTLIIFCHQILTGVSQKFLLAVYPVLLVLMSSVCIMWSGGVAERSSLGLALYPIRDAVWYGMRLWNGCG